MTFVSGVLNAIALEGESLGPFVTDLAESGRCCGAAREPKSSRKQDCCAEKR